MSKQKQLFETEDQFGEDLFTGPKFKKQNYDVYQNYEICAENRDKLKNYLEREGIRTLIQWNGKAVHQIKSLKLKADVPNTVHFFKRCIMLPIHTFLKEKEVELVMVGPEDPLVNGVVDYLENFNIKVFGPNKKASQLEGSKIFTKKICEKSLRATEFSALFRKVSITSFMRSFALFI